MSSIQNVEEYYKKTSLIESILKKNWAAGSSAHVQTTELLFSEVDENFRAYNLFSHRHTPEILDHTGLPEAQLIFSTHLLPLARGILSTLYVPLAQPQTAQTVEHLFRKFFAGRPMVRIWPAGTLPELQHV